ncbi:MAG TPA: hypothetical protein VMT38_01525 [Terracidiphilus sp.]|nr:hypothetical protein [Terracidiphilus sp.]
MARAIGLDRAVGFTVFGRMLQGLGSVVNVLLILHFLTLRVQGYYYALWSLVALQSVFELGFSFVILQVAAHERVHLQFHPNGAITGDPVARNRLASLLQRTVRWYLVASMLMGVALWTGGTRFFSLHRISGYPDIWVWPLRMTVIACAFIFALNPLMSFLEGCGQVVAVSRARFFQSMVSALAAWTAMILHHGLYAPAMVLLGQSVVASAMLWSRRSLLLSLMRMRVGHFGIRWREEVWPFQWKIAISWLCDYFIFQLFTPVIFAFRGPADAGRMGLSMNIVMQMSGMMLAWMTTKAAPFGSLIARNDQAGLDRLFFRALRQSLLLLSAAAAVVMAGVLAIPHVVPRLGYRIVSWPVFLLLLLTAIGGHVVQSEAIYLRAHKREPFLLQSIAIAAATAASVTFFGKISGIPGVAMASFIVLGVCGTISATTIFLSKRRSWGYAA